MLCIHDRGDTHVTMPTKLMAKIKQAFNERLQAEGRWPDYCKMRNCLKDRGVDPLLAWRVAGYLFAPTDGSPSEFLEDPLYAEIAKAWQSGVVPYPTMRERDNWW